MKKKDNKFTVNRFFVFFVLTISAISLSVERGDHLNAHKLFQLAITLMPYNTILWDMVSLSFFIDYF